MAYKKDNTMEKLERFAQILNGVKFFRFVFFFYSFISFVFWFLNCLEIDWLYLFTWLFIGPYRLVSLFYRPEGVSADFSLAIIGGISLIIGFVFDFLINHLYERILVLQEEEERKIQRRKMNRKRTARPATAQNKFGLDNAIPVENSKLIFIIQPHINKIKRKKADLELTFQEVELWKQRVNKRILENVSYSKPMQKGYYRKNLFLMYKDFNFIDDFLYYIKPTLDSIVLEFKKYGISISYSYVLSAISNIETLEKELDCMDTILSLNFINEFIVTNRFKITYDNKPTHQYSMILKGEYNLSKNLTISNKQPLYSLSDGKQKGEK